jgi:hypothetical protein
MSHSRFDGHGAEHDQDVQAQLCAYNTAFAELGLRFRWDARTLESLASIAGERARIAAYIEAHHAHLLTAYSVEFLSQAILDKKNAHYPARLAAYGESPTSTNGTLDLPRASSRWAHTTDDPGVPALAGA